MEKYKGISICLSALKNALSGSYVNFGVFMLYGDSALSDALRIALQIALVIPLTELMAYPKVQRLFFGSIVICGLTHTQQPHLGHCGIERILVNLFVLPLSVDLPCVIDCGWG